MLLLSILKKYYIIHKFPLYIKCNLLNISKGKMPIYVYVKLVHFFTFHKISKYTVF